MKIVTNNIVSSQMENTSNNTPLFPENLNELRSILINCNDTGIKVYPISRGYNWGLGASRPVDKSCRIINLRKLDEVHELNLEEGFVTIGPGVTQGALSDLLKDTPYMIDVTGSSRDTSVVGNALERGITYKGLRADSVIGLEVMLANGEIVQTGSMRFHKWKVKNHYKHGVGPDLTSLFFQSNFGVVTKMTYKLIRKKKHQVFIKLNFHSEDKLFESMSNFNDLIKEEIIDSVYHIANSQRAVSAMLPEIYKSENVSKKSIQRVLNIALSSDWTSSGILSADDKAVLKYKIRKLKKVLSPYARVEVLTQTKISFLQSLVKSLGLSSFYAFIKCARALMNLYNGQSTNIALGAVLTNNEYNESKNLSEQVEKSSRGFSYCLPLTKLNQESAEEMVKTINNVCHAHELDPSITLNPISQMVLEAVVSVEYNKSQVEKAKTCIRQLQETLNDQGHISYRTNINDMDLYLEEGPYMNVLRGLKESFDPNGIISPGRYLPEKSP